MPTQYQKEQEEEIQILRKHLREKTKEVET